MVLLVGRFAQLALLIFAVAVAGLVLCVCLEVEALELLVGGVRLAFYYLWLGNLHLLIDYGTELLAAYDTAKVRVAHCLLAQ